MNCNLDTLKKDEQISLSLGGLYRQFGYKKYNMSKFEEYSLYLENKNFLKSEHIITFNDLDGKLLALKPDVTLSIVKNAKLIATDVEKVYYTENVYRLAKNTKKYKEIAQMGIEALGNIDDYTTIEVLTLALSSLKEVDEDYILDISHMGFVLGLVDSLELNNLAVRESLLAAITSKNLHDLTAIANKNDIPYEITEKIKGLVTIGGSLKNSIDNAKSLVINKKMSLALEELQTIYQAIKDTPYEEKIRLDFSLINDTNYYNGIIFQGYVSKVPRMLLAGGRYDKLIQKFSTTAKAIGFALYLNEISAYYNIKNQFDYDAIVLYDKDSSPRELFQVITQLSQNGKVVFSAKEVPKDACYSTLYSFYGGKLEEIKND